VFTPRPADPPGITERDVWESARRMIQASGALAHDEAHALARGQAATGDRTAHLDWIRIAKAIEWLLSRGAVSKSQAN
jgi:hypothetical protein